MTAAQLARAAAISPAQVSQIERGHTDPSLESLRRIAKAIDIALFDLFDDRLPETARVVRRDQRMVVGASQQGIVYERVSPANARVEMLEGVLEAGTASSDELWAHPPSEECVLVLEGALVVEIEDDRIELSVGDSAYFESARPHRYVNTSSERARFVLAVDPPSH